MQGNPGSLGHLPQFAVLVGFSLIWAYTIRDYTLYLGICGVR